MSDINEITQAKFVSAVDEKYSILHKQISDHPNFDIQKINREVVLGKVSINAENNSLRGFDVNYHIIHYNKGEIDNSFLKKTKIWTITDELLITERDISGGTFEPIVNPTYLEYVERNNLPEKIPNPNYVTDEELEKIDKQIDNPIFLEGLKGIPRYILNTDWVSEYELSSIPQFIDNPKYLTLLNAIEPKKIPNQMYVSANETPNEPKEIDNPKIQLITEPKQISNPKYLEAVEKNSIGEYVDNVDWINFSLTVPQKIINPKYLEAVELNKESNKLIKNTDYISSDELVKIPIYNMLPAFTYILDIVKSQPFLLWVLLGFYIDEQDRDGFFDKYDENQQN